MNRITRLSGRLPRVFLILSVVVAGLLAGASATVRTAGKKFFSDDPLTKVPESADASKAAPWDIDLFYDLTYQLFATPRKVPTQPRAQNVNTIDEVPDSSWFTNRVGARALTPEELVAGPRGRPRAGSRLVDDHA